MNPAQSTINETIPVEEGDRNNDKNLKKLCSVPKRFILVFMGFLGYNILYMLRVNLSVAIVSMVKQQQQPQPTMEQLWNNLNSLKTNNNNSNSIINSTNIFIDDDNNNNNKDNNGTFSWNEEIQALILSSFFIGYVITQYPGGRLSDKFGSKLLFGFGIMFTSILTILSPFAASIHYSLFIFCRILEGLFEGLAFPSMHSMIAKWIPLYERSRMATFIYSGSQIGTVITMPIAALLCDSKKIANIDGFGGWPTVFYFFGLFGLLWSVLWFYLIYETPELHPTIQQKELQLILNERNNDLTKKKPNLPWKEIIKSTPMWALIIAHFGQNWGFYTFLTQLPRYFNNVLGFDIKKNGLYSSLPYLCQALVGCSCGYICDKLFSKKFFTLNQLRKTFNTIAFFGPTICLLLLIEIGSENSKWCIILFTMALGLNGMMLAGYHVTHVDMSPTFASSLMGITNCIANFAGILAPYVVGLILTETKKKSTTSTVNNNTNDTNDSNIYGWNLVFYLCCLIYVISALIFLIWGSNEKQKWDGNNDHHDTSSSS